MTTRSKPGLYTGVPAAEYHRWPAANYSTLKRFDRSPLHARHQLLHPPEPSPAMALGSAVNDAVLEPELFAEEYVAAPAGLDRRFAKDKKVWEEFQQASEGRIVLKAEEMAKCLAIRNAVWENPTASTVLGGKGHRELSFLWEDQITDTLCKGRCDFYGTLWGNSVVVDLKTTKDASPQGWPRQVANFQYHVQAAFYMDGLATLVPETERTFLWIAVENEAPFASCVYQPEPLVLEEGRRRYRNYLSRWVACQETDVWAGYPSSIQPMDLPHWAYKSDEEVEW